MEDIKQKQEEAAKSGNWAEFKRLVLLEKGVTERAKDPNDNLCESCQ